ncbi:MAG: hypothetical protein NC416_18255 [Eubacterium sp.]|nr:hypothetical protein [Eubacterium sp.]
MVERVDLPVSYVTGFSDGAWQTPTYAQRKERRKIMEESLKELNRHIDRILKDDWSMAWRVFYYICRHPELRPKLEICYQNTRMIAILHVAKVSSREVVPYEKAAYWADLLSDACNPKDVAEEFVPSREQIEFFNRYPYQEDLERSVELFEQLEINSPKNNVMRRLVQEADM